jgi:hypothetical protein
MAATTSQPADQAESRWALLLRPRWLAWHAFIVVAAVGMLFLGDWQLHRAESGNELSWAYTFEWPLFAAFAVYFWIKSLRDELREHGAAAGARPRPGGSEPADVGTEALGASSGAGAAAVADASAAATAGGAAAGVAAAGVAAAGVAAGPVQASHAAPLGRRAASWDATSWDAINWDATGQQAEENGTGKPADHARATPADGEAYLARLMAEVQRTGPRRGRS